MRNSRFTHPLNLRPADGKPRLLFGPQEAKEYLATFATVGDSRLNQLSAVRVALDEALNSTDQRVSDLARDKVAAFLGRVAS